MILPGCCFRRVRSYWCCYGLGGYWWGECGCGGIGSRRSEAETVAGGEGFREKVDKGGVG